MMDQGNDEGGKEVVGSAEEETTDKNDEVMIATETLESSAERDERDAAASASSEKNPPEASSSEQDGEKTATKKKRKTTTSGSQLPARRKKPRDAPRRPLSAYNIYFKEERAALIARSDEGNPDDDFRHDLDTIVASGKKRDDPSAVFQAASRTLATRWRTMEPKDKVKYEKLADEEMKRYRARVFEYESRMVEDARQKSLARKQGPSGGNDDSVVPDHSSASISGNQEIGNDSHRSAEAHASAIGTTELPEHLRTELPSAVRLDQAPPPPSIAYTLMQPSLQGLAALSVNPAIHGNYAFVSNAPNGIASLIHPASETGVSGFHSFLTPAPFFVHTGSTAGGAAAALAPSPIGVANLSYQESILALLQRENILQRQLDAARAANAPVAMTIFPPGTVDQDLLRRLSQPREEEDRRDSFGAYSASHPSSRRPPR